MRKKLFLDQVQRLPAISRVSLEAIALCEKPGVHVSEIVACVDRDPVVALRLLRVANSPLFSTSHHVIDLHRAVVRMGFVAVRNLLAGIASYQIVDGCETSSVTIQRHSFATASMAKAVADAVGRCDANEAFVAGLLHDIGQLVMMRVAPEAFAQLLGASAARKFLKNEESIFGINHVDLGADLLNQWHVPSPLIDVVLRHHGAEIADMSRICQCVVVADVLAQRLGFGFDYPGSLSMRYIQSLKELGLEDHDLLHLSRGIDRHVSTLVECFSTSDKTQLGLGVKKVWWLASQDLFGQAVFQTAGFDCVAVSEQEFSEKIISCHDWVVVDAQQNVGLDQLKGARTLVRLGASDSCEIFKDQSASVVCISDGFTSHDLDRIQKEVDLAA